ncbi:hypothetical protein A3K63_00760 [Candidatus Micrarchaeota archaeon RBG_16_49_10]|nr:MAG: hypothetical protein A3K63_00760 [Candidatus Micrarchaeota archaeon RBG_16_49_10]
MSKYEASALLWLLARYNPGVAHLIRDPENKKKLTSEIEESLKAIAYGISHDALDAIWEKVEDAAEIGALVPTGGTGSVSMEAASFIAKMMVLGPLARKYYSSIEKVRPGVSKALEAYQNFSNLPLLDSILTVIPEKGIAAIYAFVRNIYSIIKQGKSFERDAKYGRGDYVDDLYGKGMEGYRDQTSTHPLRPALEDYGVSKAKKK